MTIQATANEGYTFREWSDSDTHAKRTLIMNKNYSLTACFDKDDQGLENIQNSDVRIQKILRDGQLLIIRNGKMYNVQGAEVR